MTNYGKTMTNYGKTMTSYGKTMTNYGKRAKDTTDAILHLGGVLNTPPDPPGIFLIVIP